ncbi:hypothetical protein [Spirillospora sp. NPDC029432]|uniref:hypothetical protein n=1 Tax=Spirillospora sp. NPDC029432 TaxID=3154599 RepID=UPI003454937B
MGGGLDELARLTRMERISGPVPDWADVRSALGFDVPADYKRLIELYGAGAFNDYIQIYGPEESVQAFNLKAQGLFWDAYLKEEWEGSPEAVPVPLRKRDSTVLDWGCTEDGPQLLWIAERGVAPERWTVAFHLVEGEAWEFHPRSAVEVLLALARNELAARPLPPSWPSDEPLAYGP